MRSGLKKGTVINLAVACIACLMSLSHCTKDQSKPKTELEKLPAATQTGAYKFGCLVNGKAWIPKSSLRFSCDNEVNFDLWAEVQTNGIYQSIFFFREDRMSATGSYAFNDKTKQYAIFSEFNDLINTCECSADGTNGNGALTITKFDQTKLIISGTFNFTAWNTKCDTIKVTEGRFDLHYYP